MSYMHVYALHIKRRDFPPFKNSYINILSHHILRSSVCQAFAWTKIGVVQGLVELRSQSGENEGYSPRLKHQMGLER